VQVTSVSKRSQKLADAAAAFLSSPGGHPTLRRHQHSGSVANGSCVQVARIDENKWAISARGFNGRFANKLLVLIDGRSVYTLYFLEFTGTFRM